MKAPLPPCENDRILELHSFSILDTSPEQCFDEIVELAATICGTHIGAVSLVDQNRQWFKASIGLGVSETDRDSAFCAHTILNQGLMVVKNAIEDIRFKNNPLVLGAPGIRFYAGAPLITHSGFALGSLCVIDTVPREITPKQERALQILANQVMDQLEHFKMAKNLAQAAQHSAVSDLAVNLTHEINNPLSNIQARARILHEEAKGDFVPSASVREHSQRILHVVERISKILKGLKNLKKNDQKRWIVVTVQSLISDAILECIEQIREKNITLETSESSNASVFCDPIQLSQVLVNLITNAIDSIELLDERWIKIKASITETEVNIIVSDSGPPIPENVKLQMFKPFFSTKKEKGTGIGLCLSREIMREHHGALTVYLENEHPCFCMTIPKNETSAQHPRNV